MMIKKIKLLIIMVVVGAMVCACATVDTSGEQTGSSNVETQGNSWQTITGEGVTLEVPPGFIGGNPSLELSFLEAKLEAIVPNYKQKIRPLKQDPTAIALFAFDSQVPSSGEVTSINVIREKRAAEISLQDYFFTTQEQIAATLKIVEASLIEAKTLQLGRIVAEFSLEDTSIKQLFYILPEEDNFWLITYSTTAAEFAQYLPDFEKSIQSIEIKPE